MVNNQFGNSKVYSFRQQIAPKSSGSLKVQLEGHGYITKTNVHFNVGEDATLRLRPLVAFPNEFRIDLINYVGENYLSGDGVYLELPTSQEIEQFAEIVLEYDNVGDLPSRIEVDFTVHYFRGSLSNDATNVIGPIMVNGGVK